MLLPKRSVSPTPTSRDSAVTAADTDGCVTISSSAAAVTEPVRNTARKLWSWVSVIAISLTQTGEVSRDLYIDPSSRARSDWTLAPRPGATYIAPPDEGLGPGAKRRCPLQRPPGRGTGAHQAKRRPLAGYNLRATRGGAGGRRLGEWS